MQIFYMVVSVFEIKHYSGSGTVYMHGPTYPGKDGRGGGDLDGKMQYFPSDRI